MAPRKERDNKLFASDVQFNEDVEFKETPTINGVPIPTEDAPAPISTPIVDIGAAASGIVEIVTSIPDDASRIEVFFENISLDMAGTSWGFQLKDTGWVATGYNAQGVLGGTSPVGGTNEAAIEMLISGSGDAGHDLSGVLNLAKVVDTNQWWCECNYLRISSPSPGYIMGPGVLLSSALTAIRVNRTYVGAGAFDDGTAWARISS